MSLNGGQRGSSKKRKQASVPSNQTTLNFSASAGRLKHPDKDLETRRSYDPSVKKQKHSDNSYPLSHDTERKDKAKDDSDMFNFPPPDHPKHPDNLRASKGKGVDYGSNSFQPSMDTLLANDRRTSIGGIQIGTPANDGIMGTSNAMRRPSSNENDIRRVSLSGGGKGTISAVGKQAPKTLVIKNFKVKPKLPENYFDTTWAKLKNAVKAIQDSRPVGESLEFLYKSCENLCAHKMGSKLYTLLHVEFESHIQAIADGLRKATANAAAHVQRNDATEEAYLVAVNACWTAHCSQTMWIRSIFLVLDRTYVLQSGERSLWDMGLQLFRQTVLEANDIQYKTLNGISELISKERKGEAIQRPLLKSVLRMFVDLQLYSSTFEPRFMDETRAFYMLEGEQLIETMDTREYLHHVDTRLREENERCDYYLDRRSKARLTKTLEDELIARHITTVLEKGKCQIDEINAKADLALLYTLASRVASLDLLRKSFGAYIKKSGTSIVADPSRDPTMVDDLLAFKAKMDEILIESFQHNGDFAQSLKESFESFINTRQNKPAEMIAKYLDSKLKSSNKDVADDSFDRVLDQVLILFRYIQGMASVLPLVVILTAHSGKDMFEAFYKKDLAKRLLMGRSSSFDAEKSVLAKLKTECGPGFTSKLEGMFKDIDVSRDIMTSFKASKGHEEIQDLELYVNVLTQGYWPTYPPTEVALPVKMARYQETFKNFYLGKHNGRRLMWQNSLGHCQVRARFPKGQKELSVSLFQAVVLLLFNDESKERISYKEIKEQSNIEEKELKRILQSLACGKARVLTKHPKGRDVEDTDEFSFNAEFENKLTRIKINTILLKETQEEQINTTEKVFQDRQYQVDAAIVRIMKTRKTLSHTMLLTELFDQLRFTVKASDLKKRIESLIDREYMERDEDDPSLYKYLA
ncbi:hypothetical protein BZG36_01755 [Bifiguratus adelaidae]|uniref:Cullin family profile domain-containing protein n=1 Tax=Bifiguratus adelaidae TaxID=1938954 RepID=A0A261Y2W1_9FUNG|nr:hypothetical protein BZG36_01755 [Bifiguratus adelaidae]